MKFLNKKLYKVYIIIYSLNYISIDDRYIYINFLAIIKLS